MGFEFLLVLLAIVAIVTPFIVIGLWVGFANQKKRIDDLNRRLTSVQRDLGELRVSGIAPDAEPAKPTKKKAAKAKETPANIAASTAGDQDAKTATPPAVPPPPPVAPQPPRPSPVADALAKFGPWLQENWFYAVSALSLALAGIFLVQYGMENGLLPPRARVAVALAFGAALIGVGEFIRRRFGDSEESTTAYLPSVFSGAGIVTLFGGILSARMLYDLIGGGAAMSGMVIVAVIALVLGWLHGPLLAAIGIIGAYGAPVVLGSSNSDPSPLFGYFAIVAVLGLGVDTIRRWGWVSVLTLVLAFLSGMGLLGTSGQNIDWAAIPYFVVLPILAILIPARGLFPDHGGPTLTETLVSFGRKSAARPRPIFPIYLAAGSVIAATVSLIGFLSAAEIEAWMACFGLGGLTLLLILWSGRAPALQDLAAVPAAGTLFFAWMMGENWAAPYRVFRETYTDAPEAAFPWAVTVLVVMGAVLSLAAAWRSLRGGEFAIYWAAAAAVFAPAMAILLEMGWNPAAVIGPYPWALHAAVLAALMVVMAERFARADGPEQRLRTSFAVISALSSLAFACVIVLSSAALTVALAVVVVTAAALDRQWKLPPLSLFVAAGVVTLGYRLIVDPGLSWGQRAPLPEMVLAYGGTLAAFVASLWLIKPLDRPLARVMLDSAAWSTAGTLISLLIFRWIDQYAAPGSDKSHWALGLMATIWLGLALAQLQRTELGGRLRQIRWGLAAVFGLIGAGSLVAGLTAANPLVDARAVGDVLGPVLFNTLIPAYLLPALLMLAAAVRLPQLDRRIRLVMAIVAAGLVAVWATLTIRHFWQGAEGMPIWRGFSQPELYSYTVALLILGAGLFYQSLASRSAPIRKAGLIVIGLAVAKVFLIDISGLEGLTRVFSLLILGLSLAGLAWLNRWAQGRDGADGGTPPPPVPKTETAEDT